MNIVFLDRATLGPSVKFPKPRFAHCWTEYPQTSPTQTSERLQAAHIAITNKVVIDEAVLNNCPHLKYIAVAATGTNVIDVDACQARNVVVANVTDYATQDVAEHALMLMLTLCKQLKAYQQAIGEGEWQKSGQFCFFLDQMPAIGSLHGKTLGLIGTGNIARATARLATALGMEVQYYSPSGRTEVGGGRCIILSHLLKTSDIVSVHCPLTDSTQHLIGADELEIMKPSALLVNTARGPIVDIDALIHAINTGVIAGAGLDVLPQEPPAQDSPIMQAAINNPRMVITPHTAWASHNAMQTLANQLITKIEHFAALSPC
ncbi:MAG TPA: D-2-hydroxyacid dehydrogenase [Marinagarivorans sp.]